MQGAWAAVPAQLSVSHAGKTCRIMNTTRCVPPSLVVPSWSTTTLRSTVSFTRQQWGRLGRATHLATRLADVEVRSDEGGAPNADLRREQLVRRVDELRELFLG